MENQTVTYHVKTIAKCIDPMGYINYVFEDLEYTDLEYKYIMCVRFPNWNQSVFNNGDEGFVTVRYVFEGKDMWFDGEQFIPYKQTNIVFLKFIPLKPEINPSEIVLD
jgi:hypothetical protein